MVHTTKISMDKKNPTWCYVGNTVETVRTKTILLDIWSDGVVCVDIKYLVEYTNNFKYETKMWAFWEIHSNI